MAEDTQIAILPPDKTLYFNGYQIALGMGDVIITLTRNGAPVITLNASYTVAKSFGESVTGAIKKLEKETDHVIMTVDTITNALGPAANAPPPASEPSRRTLTIPSK
jgi:hypothetical protein